MSIKQDALDHYDRMVAWVWTNVDLRDRALGMEMYQAIGEWWSGEWCPYCQTRITISLYPSSCGLARTMLGCGECCSGVWNQMNSSETWGEWLVYAQYVREYIQKYGDCND